jgi:hypothetical protein
MTKIKVAEVFESMSGRYGKKHVLRSVDGRTILAGRPKRSGVKTPKQTEFENRFKEAVKYAVFAKDNPMLWQKYESMTSNGKSAYNRAVGDFISVPTVNDVDVTGYAGQPGGRIIVTAMDKFEVIGVTVSIKKADGTLLEEGPAQQRDQTNFYVYYATLENQDLAGTEVTATVTDNPGHMVTESVTL